MPLSNYFFSEDPAEELRQVRMNRIKRMESQKYRSYTPNGKAARFIQMVGENKYFINLFIAANGVGKTSTLCNILANICFAPHLTWFNYPLYHEFPYTRKGRIVSDTTTIKKTIVPELEKWFPEGMYEAGKDDKSYNSVWKTKSGVKPKFEFDVMTYEQDIKQFESATLGFIVFDEPPPEAIWKACISRMRRGGIIICCFTPLEGSAFFYDNYVTSPDVVRY